MIVFFQLRFLLFSLKNFDNPILKFNDFNKQKSKILAQKMKKFNKITKFPN